MLSISSARAVWLPLGLRSAYTTPSVESTVPRWAAGVSTGSCSYHLRTVGSTRTSASAPHERTRVEPRVGEARDIVCRQHTVLYLGLSRAGRRSHEHSRLTLRARATPRFELCRRFRRRSLEPDFNDFAKGNQPRNGPHHHHELGYSAMRVVSEQVNALDLSPANATCEAEHLAVALPNLPLISELGDEYLTNHS